MRAPTSNPWSSVQRSGWLELGLSPEAAAPMDTMSLNLRPMAGACFLDECELEHFRRVILGRNSVQ